MKLAQSLPDAEFLATPVEQEQPANLATSYSRVSVGFETERYIMRNDIARAITNHGGKHSVLPGR